MFLHLLPQVSHAFYMGLIGSFLLRAWLAKPGCSEPGSGDTPKSIIPDFASKTMYSLYVYPRIIYSTHTDIKCS
jgi:hypothetical protein